MTHMPPRTPRRGFSLVELSIVLVILGLLVGGVLSGQSLIRAAELRSVNTQLQQYMTASLSFRDKYMAMPGDMPNATRFWGEAHTTAATCITTASTGKETCNGDGSGVVDMNAPGSNETFRFWQHLANAGLIEGKYNGVSADQARKPDQVSTLNSPTGKLSGTFWGIYSIGELTGDVRYFDGTYNNYFEFGESAGRDPNKPAVKPEEAWNIDTKLDDGKPGRGRLVMRGWNVDYVFGSASVGQGCTRATASSQLDVDYNFSGTAKSCVLIVFPFD